MIKNSEHIIEKYGWYVEAQSAVDEPALTGSIKVAKINEDDILLKYDGANWVVEGSEADLTNKREDGKIKGMAKIPQLIPNADKLFDQGFNVLLVGLHGTGKTVSIQDMVDRRGLKMKYFSCSTLDPFTDLVGVPVPRDIVDENGNPVYDARGQKKQSLTMVRPHDVDEAEIIFFDELNRADAKTLNAVFEIIQFKSINGDPLPNLKVCWAAINPPSEDYDVERLDAALLDRFDLYIPIEPQPSVSYMSQFMAPQYAKALHQWYSAHEVDLRKGVKSRKTDYISPRRLVKIGQIYETFHNARMVHMTLPQGGNFDKAKLLDLLRLAENNIKGNKDGDVTEDSALGNRPNPEFEYNASWIQLNHDKVAKWLNENPAHLETHIEVANTLNSRIGGVGLVKFYHTVLEALDPKILEGMIQNFNPSKVSFMRESLRELIKKNLYTPSATSNLRSALGGDKAFGKV